MKQDQKGFLTKDKRQKPFKDSRENDKLNRDGTHIKHDIKRRIDEQRELELEYDDELDIDYRKLVK